MAEALTERQEHIADLYFLSQTFQHGGEWQLSAHRANPDLPPSPFYMHYPADSDSDTILLDLYDLVGVEFHDLCGEMDPPLDPTRIAAVPNGALPLGRDFADTYPPDGRKRLLVFTKQIDADGQVSFASQKPHGEYDKGDELVVVEDHLTAGINTGAFITAAEHAGLVVNQVLTVVDRQQGGKERLEARGVKVASILTLDKLLDVGVEHSHLSKHAASDIRAYRDANQF